RPRARVGLPRAPDPPRPRERRGDHPPRRLLRARLPHRPAAARDRRAADRVTTPPRRPPLLLLAAALAACEPGLARGERGREEQQRRAARGGRDSIRSPPIASSGRPVR